MVQKARLFVSAALVLCALAISLLTPGSSNAATITTNIWPATTTPPATSDVDDNSVELGVKFRSSVDGYVSGVRFYKNTGNSGTHTGSLWDMNGNQLATVTFTGETATGWQQALFTSPVAITANTTYVVSYHAPAGHYTASSGYFSNTAATNGPLTALQNGTDGPNGVYAYSSSATFPTSSYNAANYWVDAVFTYSNGGPDTTPPVVNTTTPLNGASNIAANSSVRASFDEPIDPSTITTSSFTLASADHTLVPATVSYDAADLTATLTPNAALTPGATYTATLASGIADTSGNTLALPYTWSFSVTPPPPPNTMREGHGGPILVLDSTTNPFSSYYAEILRAEGLNSFTTDDIATITADSIAPYDVIILGDESVTDAQVTLLTDWVNAGGNLIAMHPNAKLSGLLGLTNESGTLADGYMLIDTSQAPGSGITGVTMQYHGSADRYSLASGTRAVAALYSDATTATTNPAVTLRSVGGNGGHAGAFTYDLARSVVYTHQGNPAWAGEERDGIAPIRPDDMFYGAKAGDVQPDYVNLDKVAIPQADEQQRLLSNMIEDMESTRLPLPKFWYFPNDNKAVIVMAGDDHDTSNGTQTTFDNLIANSPAGCVVSQWQCYRATSWMYTDTPLSNDQAATYESEGFDLGVHVSTGCADWTPASLDSDFANDLAGFQAKYTSLPAQHDSRTHCIVWDDWATTPKVEAKYGIRMDLNYYYWPSAWVQDRPGFFTGSGIPMRYADSDGSMIDVYQEPSDLVNESGQTFPQNIDTQLDRALGPDGYYGAIGTHYDYTDNFAAELMDAAKSHGVPLVSVQQMLDWTDARNNSYYSTPSWDGNNLSFTATVDSNTNGMLRGMLPMSAAKGSLLGISKDGQTVSYTVDTRKGIEYAIFPVTSGTYTAAYGADTTAPTMTGSVPTANATDVAIGSDLTATFSEPLDPTSVSTTSAQLLDSTGTPVSATVSYQSATNKVVVHPTALLAGNTSYQLVLHGGTDSSSLTDMAGNPLATDIIIGFTTGASTISLWNSAAISPAAATTDTAKVELGLRFSSDDAGYIDAIRFYKAANDAPTHTVTLWDSTGTALGTATTTSETATGWQTATFASPIAINANQTYTASYLAPAGDYAYTSNYFANAYTSSSLHVPANGGVYTYGGGYPTSTYGGSNYWIDVVFDFNSGSQSGTGSNPPDTTPPVVSATTASDVTETSATITWTTNEPADTQIDYGTTTSYGTTTTLDSNLATNHNQTLSGLIDGTTYHYRVRSRDAAGNLTVSADNTFTTVKAADTTPPSAPANLTGTSTIMGTANLSWQTASDNVGVVGYDLYRSNAAGFTPDSSNRIASATGTTYTDTAVPGTYYYLVEARDAAGNTSSASNELALTIIGDTVAPSAPTNLVATALSQTQVSLSWTAASDNVSVMSYTILRDGIALGSTDGTTYSDTTAIANTTYTYTVVANDAAGNSSTPSTASSVTTPPVSAPATITVDNTFSTHQAVGSKTMSVTKLTTAQDNELLVAFIGSDGPNASNAQSITSVTGGGLTWTLQKRVNDQAGTSEIWTAAAVTPLSDITVTATRANGAYVGMMTVVAFQNANLTTSSHTGGNSARSGAPNASLTLSADDAWVWGVGNDWDSATSRTLGSEQTRVDEFLANTGDTFWVQCQAAAGGKTGDTVTLNDSAPTADRWNLATIEILPR